MITLEQLREYKREQSGGVTLSKLREYKRKQEEEEKKKIKLTSKQESNIKNFKLEPDKLTKDIVSYPVKEKEKKPTTSDTIKKIISGELYEETKDKENPLKKIASFSGKQALGLIGAETKRLLSRTEEEKQTELKEFAQTKTGAFGYGVTGGVSKFILPGEKGKELFETAQEAQPGMYTTGNVTGTTAKYLILYNMIGPSIEKIPGFDKIGSKFLKEMAMEISKDIAIGLPVGVLDSLADNKKGKELVKDAAVNLATDAIANAAFYGLGKGIPAIKKAYEASKAKKVQEAVNKIADSVKQTDVKVDVSKAAGEAADVRKSLTTEPVAKSATIEPTKVDTVKASKVKYNTYEEYQKAIDDYTDELTKKYGETEALFAPIPDKTTPADLRNMNFATRKPSKISEPELKTLQDLYSGRDIIAQVEKETVVKGILDNINFNKNTDEWIASKESVEKVLNKLYRDNELNIAFGKEVAQSVDDLKRKLYNGLIQKAGAPSELWGEYDIAKEIIEVGEKGSPFGKSLKPLFEQIDDIVNSISKTEPQPVVKQLSSPTVTKSATVDTPKVEAVKADTIKSTDIPAGSPKTAAERKIVDDYVKTLPKDELGLEKTIKTLERQAKNTKDEKKLLKINLQLFAAKAEKAKLRERGFSANVRSDSYMNPEIKKSFNVEPLEYEQLSNKVTEQKAKDIFSQGFDKALRDWDKNLENFRPEDIPLARMLANKAANDGNMELARQIISDTAEKLTKAGQYTQAAKLLRQSDPITALTYIEKELDKLNKAGRKTYGKKWKDFNLTDDEFTKLRDSTSETRDKILQDLGNRISQNMPSAKMEKFDAWRRMAMLLNPKTHIRNTIGNVIMMGMRKAGDTIGAGLEKVFVKQSERTKSFLWSRNKDLVKTVDEVWNGAKDDLLRRSRWSIENLRFAGKDKRVFKSGTLDFLDRLSKTTLEAEDIPFVKTAYKDALGQFMSARGLKQATEEAMDYAKRRAYEATFKQANMLSGFLSQAKKVKGVGKFVEAAIPFSQTPTNILARSVEYSPIGLVKALYSKMSGKTAATVIEDLSKGLTGTAIAGLGYMLASQGWMRVERSTSKNVEGIMTQFGQQPLSITTPLGNYTFDWAQPFSVPFAMGASVFESLDKNEDVDMVEAIKEALAAGGDTVFDLSMMQNIKGLFGGGYGSPTEAIMDLPVSYIEQAFPTAFGQVARVVDPVRRTTYDPNELKAMGRKFLAKTPIASRVLEPNLDVWGNEQSQGGAFQQFINPSYAKKISTDTTTLEIVKLYKSTKDTSFLPKIAPKKFTVDGKEIELTPKEITAFQKSMGQQNYNMIKSFVTSRKYSLMSDEAKVKAIKKIVDDNYYKVKETILKNRE